MSAQLSLSIHKQDKQLDDYESFTSKEELRGLKQLASLLSGICITHVNSTYFGGGVAENLSSLVAITKALNIHTCWQVLQAPREFFEATKTMHNALHGMRGYYNQQIATKYLHHNHTNGELLRNASDVVIVHDPQPLPLIDFRKDGQKRIWRCHVDLSDVDPVTWQFLVPYVARFDALIFTLPSYVKDDLVGKLVFTHPPGIDPLSEKNKSLTFGQIKNVLARFGIKQDAPLITQVSRFDPWKNPLGVIDIYRLVKKRLPDLQLALVGSLANDDPEGEEWLKKTRDYASADTGIHILSNLTDTEVNAIQRVSNVIIQNSIREGFGLTVSEALWKRTPVVARRTGGITLQVIDGVTGFLCDSIQQMAEKTAYLLMNSDVARKFGDAGHAFVRRKFLVTGQLMRELSIIAGLLGLDTTLGVGTQ